MKKIIVILLNLGLSAVLIFVFAVPFFDSVQIAKDEASTKETKVIELREVIEETKRLSEEYKEVSEDANKFLLALPEDEDVPHLLVQFEELAQSSGLLLESVALVSDTEDAEQVNTGRTSALSGGGSLKVLKATIVLSGSYDALKGYLIALENSLRPIDVYSIGFTSPSKQEEVVSTIAVFKFSLSVGVYYTS